MLYDLSHQLVDDVGNAATDAEGKAAELKTVLSKALLTDTADNAKSKLERFELWFKVKSAELKLELSNEEAKLIKEASSVYSTLIHGQIARWIENKL